MDENCFEIDIENLNTGIYLSGDKYNRIWPAEQIMKPFLVFKLNRSRISIHFTSATTYIRRKIDILHKDIKFMRVYDHGETAEIHIEVCRASRFYEQN